MRKIRIGVLGIGFGQQVHVPAFRCHPQCEVVAICARRLERAQEVAQRLGIPRAVSHWQELLGEDIDALAIATPPAVQSVVALAALAAEKAVFCEKPLAATLAQAIEMTAIARKSGIANMVDLEFLEIAVWRQALAVLKEGGIGRLRHVTVTWHVETQANRLGLATWKTSAPDGGGTLMSFVSHVFYYLEQMAGRIAGLGVRLTRFPRDTRTGDTLVSGTLEFEGGALATLSVCSAAFLGSGHRVELYGDGGALVLANTTGDYARGFRLYHGTRQSGLLKELEIIEDVVGEAEDGRISPVSRLTNRFVDWILTGRQAVPSFADGLRVQSLLEAARRSDECRAWVDVPFGE